MSSKRKGRDWQHQKDRKRWAMRLRDDGPHPCARCGALLVYHGYEWDLGHPEGAHLARVADAAKAEGYREGADGQLQRFSVNGYRNSQGEWINCGCRLCSPEARCMVVCGDCGNKRCPRAQDHANLCTHSNEPGQVASACGYICACPAIPSAWAPGSVTR